MRETFVELAAEEAKRAGQKVTVSRLHVMTGLNRREVTRIHREGEPMAAKPNVASRVLANWGFNKEFLTAAGKPRVLTYTGDESEFHKLVATVSKEVSPKNILLELERIGAIEKTKRGVKLVHTIEFVQNRPLDAYGVLARDIELVSQVVEENVFWGRKTRNHHSRTEFDNIYQDDLPKIREWLFEQGAEFHKKVRTYLASYDKDIDANPEKEGGASVAIGSFSWTDNVEEDST